MLNKPMDGSRHDFDRPRSTVIYVRLCKDTVSTSHYTAVLLMNNELTMMWKETDKVKISGTSLKCQNYIHEEINSRLNSGNACYHKSRTFCLPVCYPKVYTIIILPVFLTVLNFVSHIQGGT